VLYVSTFDVDATPDAVVDYLSAPAGWLVFVPGFAAGCEVVELGDTAAAGFRATMGSNNWMWVTDIATFRREGGGASSGGAAASESSVGGAGDANGPTNSDGGTVVFTCRITVTDPEEGSEEGSEELSPVRPTATIFTVLQTWTLTPRRFGAQGLLGLSDAERRGIGGASTSSDSGVGGFGGGGTGCDGCTVERKFTDFDGSETLRGFLLGGMIDAENANVKAALAMDAAAPRGFLDLASPDRRELMREARRLTAALAMQRVARGWRSREEVRALQHAELEAIRMEVVNEEAACIQDAWRGYMRRTRGVGGAAGGAGGERGPAAETDPAEEAS
jgi:hypothetical protein